MIDKLAKHWLDGNDPLASARAHFELLVATSCESSDEDTGNGHAETICGGWSVMSNDGLSMSRERKKEEEKEWEQRERSWEKEGWTE